MSTRSAAAEPAPQAQANPARRFLLATRPAFLGITALGALLGLASAHASSIVLRLPEALVTVCFAMVAHAGINVLNDYYDHLNGSDAANRERLFPFTGGSRFIQNGVLTPRTLVLFGYMLLLLVVPAGLWLTWRSGSHLLWIGVAGLFLGWAYSVPPLKLMSRGLGEVAVAGGWLLIVVGADAVQRQALNLQPWLLGLPYALLVSNILFLNQFPDYRADASVGKRNWVVRLGPQRAHRVYPFIALLAHGWLAGLVALGRLPTICLAGLISLPFSLQAASVLRHHAGTPAKLLPAIHSTLLATHLHGVVMIAVLAFTTY